MIEQLKQYEGRIATLEEALKNILRVGVVVDRDVQGCRCRVQFPDNAALVSYWCQVLVAKAQKDKFFELPDLDELVVCLFLPFGHEQGFIVGSGYNREDLVPDAATRDRILVRDKGDNEVLMDRVCRKLRARTVELHLFGDLIVHGRIYGTHSSRNPDVEPTRDPNDVIVRPVELSPSAEVKPWDCGP